MVLSGFFTCLGAQFSESQIKLVLCCLILLLKLLSLAIFIASNIRKRDIMFTNVQTLLTNKQLDTTILCLS